MLTEMFGLAGRVAIVTGASSGLGMGFARTLASAGATVYAAARRLDRLQDLAAEVPGIVPVRCDITDDADRRALIDRCYEQSGRLDVLVNNAGMPGPPNAEDETIAGFNSVLELNLVSGFHLATYASNRLQEN